MCNRLHADYKKVALEGKAYKLGHLSPLPSSKWTGLQLGSDVYEVDTDGWIRWKDHTQTCFEIKTPAVLGFCFIPTLKGALKTHESWRVATGNSVKIVEVMYKQGLGRFMESDFIGGLKIDIMLAKEFKIIKEVKI